MGVLSLFFWNWCILDGAVCLDYQLGGGRLITLLWGRCSAGACHAACCISSAVHCDCGRRLLVTAGSDVKASASVTALS